MMRSYLPASWTTRVSNGDGVSAAAAESAALDALRPGGMRALAALPDEDVLGCFCARGAPAADTVLLEFLRLSGGNPRKAETAVKGMVEWRSDVKVWEVGTEREDVLRYLGSPGVEFPLWICEGGRIGYMSVKNVPKKFAYPMMERGVGVLLDWVLYQGPETGNGLIAVADFAGFSVSQADVRALTITVRTYMKAYPGAFRKIIIVNYPVAIYGCMFTHRAGISESAVTLRFPPLLLANSIICLLCSAVSAVWKIVTPLLDQRTHDAIMFLSSTKELKGELERLLPLGHVPDFMGGSLETPETQSGSLQLANQAKLDTVEIAARLC